MIRALDPYPRDKQNLIRLLVKIKQLGVLNCNFEQFNDAYIKWNMVKFPNTKVDNGQAALFRDDWFADFVNFLCNYDIETGVYFGKPYGRNNQKKG